LSLNFALQSNLNAGTKTMAGNAEDGGPRRASRIRVAGWAAAGLVLLLPLIAMQFTDEVNWTISDFVFAGALIVGVAVSWELTVRMTGNFAYRAGAGVALAAAFLLVWLNGAVGIIGSENNDANLMYGGVLAVGIIGAFVARLQPHGMSRAMFATAAAQTLVPAIALVTRWGVDGPISPGDVVMLTGFFVALWLGSGCLFREAALGRAERGGA
jgi:hypothetical protein